MAMVAFNTVFNYVCTRDLVQEHLAYMLFLVKASWCMLESKGDRQTKHEVKAESLVRL